MSKYERKIILLTDDEISYILTGLRLLSMKCIKDNDGDLSLCVDNLSTKIDNCYEMGVISNEKIKYGE